MGKESKADKYLRERDESNQKLVEANATIEVLNLQMFELKQKLLQSSQQFKNFTKAMKNSVEIFEEGCKEFNEEVEVTLLRDMNVSSEVEGVGSCTKFEWVQEPVNY